MDIAPSSVRDRCKSQSRVQVGLDGGKAAGQPSTQRYRELCIVDRGQTWNRGTDDGSVARAGGSADCFERTAGTVDCKRLKAVLQARLGLEFVQTI